MAQYKKILVGIGILIVLSPLGLIADGTAWGEWGQYELKNILGYVPKGLAKIADINHIAFLPDYSLPSGGHGILGAVAGYYISVIVGVSIIGVIVFTAGRIIVRKEKFYRK